MSDQDLSKAAAQNVPGANPELYKRSLQATGQWPPGGDSGSSYDPPIGAILAIVVIAVVVWYTVAGLANGISFVANESFLAPLFPRPGDSLARYLVSVSTLFALLPGTLVVAANTLRGRRLHFMRRLILYPLAFILVPTILLMTVSTTTAEVVRLAS